MRGLTAAEVLRVWEAGLDQHPLDRALTLLSAGEPRARRADLAALSVAERDRRLLRLRAATLGPALAAFTECPRCGERLELSLDTSQIAPGDDDGEGRWEAEGAGVRLRFRLPDSHDLAAAAQAGGVDAARRLLAARCILAATGPDGAPLPPELVPEEALAAMSRAMADAAPEAEVSLALACGACGAAWESVLDVAAFFWAELAVRARRLLREVDVLARAYHWSEAEILALTPRRRRAYLEMAEG